MGNKYLEDRPFQDSKDLLVMLLKLMEKETKGMYKFVGEYPTGIYYTLEKRRISFVFALVNVPFYNKLTLLLEIYPLLNLF